MKFTLVFPQEISEQSFISEKNAAGPARRQNCSIIESAV